MERSVHLVHLFLPFDVKNYTKGLLLERVTCIIVLGITNTSHERREGYF